MRGTWGAVFYCFSSIAVLHAQSRPIVWTIPALQRIGPDDTPGTGTQVHIWAARGEYESFQIVVRGPRAGLSDVNLLISDLSGPGGALIPGSSFMLFREHFVHVGWNTPYWGGASQGRTNPPLPPGWYPDPLIPFVDPDSGAPLSGGLKAVPVDVAANRNQPFWVDVLVPRTAPAGRYAGSFTVTSAHGNVTGRIVLTVWNFTLPLKPSLKTSCQFWRAGNLHAQRELLRHRLMPLTVSPIEERQLIDGYGLRNTHLGFFTALDTADCRPSLPPSVAELEAAAATHEPDLFLFNYTADEIDNYPCAFSNLKHWARHLHRAGVQNLVTMMPAPELLDDGSGTGRSVVDIWVVLPWMYDKAARNIHRVLAKGDEVWSYNTGAGEDWSPKWLIDFLPINLRIQPGFISQSLGLTGLLYWRVDLWSPDPWNDVMTPLNRRLLPGEGLLVYPGGPVGIPGVAPSLRLKSLRDGVEDYEYIELLKKAGYGEWALQIARTVGPDWTNWTHDADVLIRARQRLGEKLDSLGRGTSPTPPSAPANAPPVDGKSSVSPLRFSANPSSGAALSQTFTFVYSDDRGYADLAGGSVLFGANRTGVKACWLYYDRKGNTLWLARDDGVGWDSLTLGASGTLQNSQCTINSAGVSAFGSRNDLTLKAAITFKTAFAGTKNIYMHAKRQSGLVSDSVISGTWTVPATGPARATPVSVSPAAGAGLSQTFTFVYSDPNGYTDIAGANALFGPNSTGVKACWLYYDRGKNALWLARDDGANWDSLPLGAPGTLQNRQCAIRADRASASGSGNILTLRLAVTFRTAFAGMKNIYMRAKSQSGSVSDFVHGGTWRVPNR